MGDDNKGREVLPRSDLTLPGAENGLPGYSYHIQRATTLSPANWTNVQAVTCDSTGYATWTDSSVDTTQSSVYYRLSYP